MVQPEILDLQMAYLTGWGYRQGYPLPRSRRAPDGEENFYRYAILKNGKELRFRFYCTFSVIVYGKIAAGFSYLVFQKNDRSWSSGWQLRRRFTNMFDLITDWRKCAHRCSGHPRFKHQWGALGYFSAYAVDRKQIIIR
jgi:hypothetical protein